MNWRKNKIKGISFHHKSSINTKKSVVRLEDFFNLNDLSLQIEKETPTPFTNNDIIRFLCDHGRNEINSRISQCIDFSTKWTGIFKAIERCFPNKYFLNQDYLTEMAASDSNLFVLSEELEIYLAIKKLVALWKHNLNILEMTAQAQYFIQFQKYKPKAK